MKEIKLTQGKVALVDDENFEVLNSVKWVAHKEGNTFYAIRTPIVNGVKTVQRMHRVILGLTDKRLLVDHIDGDGLNNTMANLRPCTKKQNQKNVRSHRDSSSKYLGVSFRKTRGNYRARIYENGKEVSLGHFSNEKDAAIAYNIAAIRVHGEFANLNKV